MRLVKRLLFVVIALLLVIALAGFLFVRSVTHPMPASTPGADADALARAMQAAVHHDAWLATGAVQWTFRGENRHLWDRNRGFARVEWREDETPVTVLLDLARRDGVAWRAPAGADGPVPAEGDELRQLLDQAWSFWCNDSFWLNPIAKLFDEGTERGLVRLDAEPHAGRRGLLVRYTSGGVTPGDAYLWILGDDDRPVAWRMWTQILPVDGLETTWDGWTELDTGAVVSTAHETPLGTLELTAVRGASDLGDLVAGPDPFMPLVQALGG